MTELDFLGKMRFEKGQHGDLDSKTFEEVYETRPVFVKFTLLWTSATGQYEAWKNYVELRNKQENKLK